MFSRAGRAVSRKLSELEYLPRRSLGEGGRRSATGRVRRGELDAAFLPTANASATPSDKSRRYAAEIRVKI